MEKTNIGFYLTVVAVSFVLGSIVGGLITHYVSRFFRQMDDEFLTKRQIDYMDER